MEPISVEIVTKTWQEQARMSAVEASKLIDRMGKEQAIVLAYLMGAEGDQLKQDERQLLLYLGVAVWRMMSQGSKKLTKVSEAMVEEMEQKNTDLLERLQDKPEGEFVKAAEAIVAEYNQKEVFKYVLEALFGEEHEESDIREEMKGIIAMDLKTVIDCLDQ